MNRRIALQDYLRELAHIHQVLDRSPLFRSFLQFTPEALRAMEEEMKKPEKPNHHEFASDSNGNVDEWKLKMVRKMRKNERAEEEAEAEAAEEEEGEDEEEDEEEPVSKTKDAEEGEDDGVDSKAVLKSMATEHPHGKIKKIEVEEEEEEGEEGDEDDEEGGDGYAEDDECDSPLSYSAIKKLRHRDSMLMTKRPSASV